MNWSESGKKPHYRSIKFLVFCDNYHFQCYALFVNCQLLSLSPCVLKDKSANINVIVTYNKFLESSIFYLFKLSTKILVLFCQHVSAIFKPCKINYVCLVFSITISQRIYRPVSTDVWRSWLVLAMVLLLIYGAQRVW